MNRCFDGVRPTPGDRQLGEAAFFERWLPLHSILKFPGIEAVKNKGHWLQEPSHIGLKPIWR